jgi:hypothetical protein
MDNKIKLPAVALIFKQIIYIAERGVNLTISSYAKVMNK